MYQTETQENTATALLDDQLRGDESGQARDRLIDELNLAADEIRAALGEQHATAELEILKDLLEAVALSETVVADVWSSFHGIGESAARLSRR